MDQIRSQYFRFLWRETLRDEELPSRLSHRSQTERNGRQNDRGFDGRNLGRGRPIRKIEGGRRDREQERRSNLRSLYRRRHCW